MALSKYSQIYFLVQMLLNLEKKEKKEERLSRIHLHSLHDIFFQLVEQMQTHGAAEKWLW